MNSRRQSNIEHNEFSPNYHSQQGLTLIELMISITLGLLISAAAFQIFANSVNSQRIQGSAADVQDASVFSLNYMKKEIALANLGASTAIKQETPWTGVVFTSSFESGQSNKAGVKLKIGNLRGINMNSEGGTSNVSDSLLTKSKVGPNNLIPSTNSDQLTLQYKAPFDGYDCEGDKVKQGDMVIERFFTRVDNQKASNETDNLAIVLACDAGTYTLSPAANPDDITVDIATIKKFGDNGMILVNRVDYFEVKLGVQTSNGLTYLSIDEYVTKTSGQYAYDAPIVAVQLGVITRGDSAVSGDTQKVFSVNGVERTVSSTAPNYIRRVYQSMVGLRNSGSRL